MTVGLTRSQMWRLLLVTFLLWSNGLNALATGMKPTIERDSGCSIMADFVAKQKQFAAPKWSDQIKRDRTIQALINIMKTRARIGFAAVVAKSAYDDVIVNGALRRKFGDNHYAFCIRVCTAMVNRWREQYHYGQPVQYVFDRLSEGQGEIDAMFGILVSGGDDAMRRYGVYKGCWSFQDKAQVNQLQGADIWAWENYRYAVDCFFPEKNDKPSKQPRRSYLALRDAPCMVKYHIADSLRELVKEVSDWTQVANKPSSQ